MVPSASIRFRKPEKGGGACRTGFPLVPSRGALASARGLPNSGHFRRSRHHAAGGGPRAFQADTADSLVLYPRASYAWEYSLGPTYGDVTEARANDPAVFAWTSVLSISPRDRPRFPPS